MNSYLFFFLCIGWAFTQFTPDDSNYLSNKINTIVLSKKSNFENLDSLFYSVASLSSLDLKALRSHKEICKSPLLQNEIQDTAQLYKTLKVMSLLECDILDKPAIKESIVKRLKDTNQVSIVNIYYCLKSLSIINDGNDELQLDNSLLLSVEDSVIVLFDKREAQWKNSQPEDSISPYYSGLALSILSQISKIKSELSESSLDSMSVFLTKLGTKLGRSSLFKHFNSNEYNSLQTSSIVLSGIKDYIESGFTSKISLSSIQIETLTNYLLSFKKTDSVENAYYFITAIQSLASSPLSPMIVSVIDPVLEIVKENGKLLKVSVTDINGKYIDASLIIQKVKSESTDTITLSKQSLVKEGNYYIFDFLASRPETGKYILDIIVSPKSGSSSQIFQRYLSIATTASFTDGTLFITGANKASKLQRYDAFQNKPLTSPITLEQSNHLYLQFKIKNSINGRSISIQQAFLTLTNSNKNSKSISIAASMSNSNVYEVHFDPSVHGKELDYNSGKYSLSIIIGDQFVTQPINWKLGEIDLKFTIQKESEEKESVYGSLPELTYETNETIDNPLYSNFLTLLVLLLPVGFFIAITLTGVKFQENSQFGSQLFTLTIQILIAIIIYFSLIID